MLRTPLKVNVIDPKTWKFFSQFSNSLYGSRHLPDTFQTPSRHFPDTFQIPSRFLPDNFQTTSRHLTCTFQTPSIHNLDNIQTLPDIFKGHIGLIWAFQTPSRHVLDTFQTPSRHPPDTLQTPLRHPPDTIQTTPDTLHSLSRPLSVVVPFCQKVSFTLVRTIQVRAPAWAPGHQRWCPFQK